MRKPSSVRLPPHNPLVPILPSLMFHKLFKRLRIKPLRLFRWRKKRRGEAQTEPPSPLVLHANDSTHPPLTNHPAPLNPADRPPSSQPIGRTPRGGNEYVPPHHIPSTPTIEPPPEAQPVPDILIHGSPSVSHISCTAQDSNKPVPPQLDPTKDRSLPGNSPVAQTSDASQGVNDSPSPLSICAVVGSPTCLAPPTPTTTKLPGMTNYAFCFLFVDISAAPFQILVQSLVNRRRPRCNLPVG